MIGWRKIRHFVTRRHSRPPVGHGSAGSYTPSACPFCDVQVAHAAGVGAYHSLPQLECLISDENVAEVADALICGQIQLSLGQQRPESRAREDTGIQVLSI